MLETAPRALAQGPFRCVDHGPGLKASPGSADWGFVAEFIDGAGLSTWPAMTAHGELAAKAAPITARAASIQL